MPWEIKKEGDQFCVYKKAGGKVACHATRDKAVRQLRALYANEGKSFNEKCSVLTTKAFSLDDTSRESWIQVFPFGHWPHPQYTDTTINKDRAERLVKNYKDNVRRQKVSTDYDHGMDKAKGNKASGEYKDMEVRSDGVYALIEWTENAFNEIRAGEWKYFSPTFLDVWEDAELSLTYEDVVIGGGLTNQPWMKDMVPINFSEVAIEGDYKRFKLDEDTLHVTEDGSTWRPATLDEVKEWEHSEPGTGSPPVPRTDGDGSDDLGDRVQSPPDLNDDGTPKDKGGEFVVKLSKEQRKLLGLNEDEAVEISDAEFDAALTKMFSEAKAHRDHVAATDRAKSFAEQFPEEYEALQASKQRENKLTAKEFSEPRNRVTKIEGENTVKTNKGMSSLVIEKMEDAHIAIKTGDPEAMKKFGEFVDAVNTDKAFVPYGESGSARVEEGVEDELTDDKSTAAKKLAEAAWKIVNDSEGTDTPITYPDALTKAAREHPDWAKTYSERRPSGS